MLRAYLFAIGGGAGAAAVVAVGIVAFLPKSAPAPKKEPAVRVVQPGRPTMCKLVQEMHMSGKNMCIYDCGRGQKSRVEGVEKCLPEIEI